MLLSLFSALALTQAPPLHFPTLAAAGVAASQDAETVGEVIREYQDAFAEWMDVYSSATDPQEKQALVPKLPRPDQYAPRLLAIVERAPRSGEAYTALSWIYGESKGRELRDEALARMSADFGDQSCLLSLAPMLERDEASTARAAAEQLAASSPHERVRGAMLLAAAGWLVRFGTVADRARIEENLETVVREYGRVDLPGQASCGEDARRRLFELQNLLEGCLAPGIEGIGLDGEPMSLESHRGSVVVLTFWASWCGGCMMQVAYERELIEEHSGRPFVVLGVNAEDGDPEEVRADAESRGITWRSFRNGSAGLRGPITDAWNVRTLPTTYVIGHDGRIVKRWAGSLAKRDELEKAVSAALAAAEASAHDARPRGR